MSFSMRFWLFSLSVAVATAAVFYAKPPEFKTSLEDLVGGNSFSLPESVRRQASSRVQVLVSSRSFDKALALADKFSASLDGDLAKTLRFRVEDGRLPEILEFYRSLRGSLMSQRDRKRLEAGTLAGAVLARTISPVPSLFAFNDDPFRFLDDFVKTLPRGFGGLKVERDVLTAEKDGVRHLLLSFELPGADAFDVKRLPAVLGPVVELCEKLNRENDGAELALAGVPVHTLETSGRCEMQIGLLSAFSSVFIFALAFGVLKSLKNVGLVAANLILSASSGFLAVCLAFDSIHLMSLVFGTTLIGLAVDYSFHRFLACGGWENTRANLWKSYLTSMVSFLPLAFSGFPVLTQAAVFLAAGISSSLVCNVIVFGRPAACPRGAPPFSAPESPGASGRFGTIAALTALCACLAVVFSAAEFRTEAQDLHSPSRKLKDAEALIAGLSGLDGGGTMAVVGAADLESALEKEERLFPDVLSLAKFVPSFAVRSRNHRSMEEFHEKSARKIAADLGLEGEVPHPPPPRRLTADDIPRTIAGQFLFSDGSGGVMTFIPNVPAAVKNGIAERGEAGVKFYSPRTMLMEMLGRFGEKTLRMLGVSFALLLAVLFAFYGIRAFLMILPSALAVSAVFAFVALSGGNVNVFHLLAAFMIIGITLDYTIFLAAGFRRGVKPVLCSLLTSMAGFGALAFVSFPVVSSVGTALGIALPVAFIAAAAIFRPAADAGGERAASRSGMEFSYLIYRVFGKRALDFIAVLVAGAVWMFDAKARKAAKTRRRLVNFALSLGDKIAVLSMGPGQPKVSFDGDGDGGRFVADVAAGKGVVVVSSHLGCIETLAAYGECAVKFHVFMALSLTGIFRAFKERHARRSAIVVHPTEGFSMAELFLGAEIVERGDVVLIAGDRGGGRFREMPFLGGARKFPEGAFRFAKHLERPVYFVASVRESGGYRVFAKLLSADDLLGDYVRELERLVKMYPDQWYQWEDDGNG